MSRFPMTPEDQNAVTLSQVQSRSNWRAVLREAIEAVLRERMTCASQHFPCNDAAALADLIMAEVERRPEVR